MRQKGFALPLVFIIVAFAIIGIGYLLIKSKNFPLKKVDDKRQTPKSLDECSFSQVPSQILQKGDEYIVSQVEEDYFKQNFTYDSSYTASGGGVDCDPTTKVPRRYFLFYKYKSLSEFIGETAWAQVYFWKDGRFDQSHGIFNCMEEKQKCDFNITKDDALAIAREKGFSNVSEISITDSPDRRDLLEWSWKVTETIKPNKPPLQCGEYKTMDIGLSTGKTSRVRGGLGPC